MNDEQRQALMECINEQEFNVAVTLNFDFKCLHTLSPANTKKTLRAWDAAINRKLLGKNWRKKEDQHIEYFAFVEKQEEDPHYHLLVKVPEHELKYFAEQAKITWQKLKTADKTDKGVKISILYNQADWLDYITKELTNDSWLYSKEFKI